jgi:hypothetical protein
MRFLAAFITITRGFEFSVHTAVSSSANTDFRLENCGYSHPQSSRSHDRISIIASLDQSASFLIAAFSEAAASS